MQADILITGILPVAVFIIMFGMGLSLRMVDFTYVIKQPKTIFLGIFAQMIALPLIAFLEKESMEKFKKVMPSSDLIRYFQMENCLQLLREAKTASQIPLVEPVTDK